MNTFYQATSDPTRTRLACDGSIWVQKDPAADAINPDGNVYKDDSGNPESIAVVFADEMEAAPPNNVP